jgi:large subunit ribosomal protein L10
MKIGSLVREKILGAALKKKETAQSAYIVGFGGLSAVQLTALRKTLKVKKASMYVAKNTLIGKTYADLDFGDLLKGQSGVVYADGDIVEIAKALVDFRTKNEALIIKGAVLNNQLVGEDQVVALSKLPTRDVLIGMTVNAIAAPIGKFVTTLNQMIAKFPQVVNAIKDKKEQQG